MAKLSSSSVQVYYGIYNAGTATRMISVVLEQEALDQTALGDLGEKFLAGIRKDAMQWDGLFDDSASAEQAGADLIGSTSNNIMSVWFGTGIGSIAYVGSLILSATKPAGKIGELAKLTLEAKPFGTWQRGLIQATSTVTTGTVSQAFGTLDGSALSTNGGTWTIHVLARTGAGTSLFYGAHATTATGVYTNIGTVSVSTAGVYTMAVTGTVNRFTQVYEAGVGTGTFVCTFVRS